jgi:predicted ATPase
MPPHEASGQRPMGADHFVRNTDVTQFTGSFESLPPEFQDVLRRAEDTLQIELTPLQELKGGRTGAHLYLVSVSFLPSRQVRHLILKLDRKGKTNEMDELERHRKAVMQAPPGFARDHLADLAFDRIETDVAVAIFYSIAGQSLQHYSSLANYQQQSKHEAIFGTTSTLLLTQWNAASTFEKAVHPQNLLARWLGYRLKTGSSIERFLEDTCHIRHDTPGFLIGGKVFPNPLVYSRESELWNAIRPIDVIVGFQHGDLNTGNILARFGNNDSQLTGLFFIDFALFKPGMPLLYDQCYLEVSYLIRELSRISLPTLVDMISRFADSDILDPHQVPIELAGVCSVIDAGRRAFGNWVQESHPSLADDLWGQFWLAAVAAGLNFCNKTAILEKERLAGLVYASAHLKRFHSAFGLPLPVEVKHLEIISQPGESSAAASDMRLHRIPKHNLPSQTTPFIGRHKEVTIVTGLLQRNDVRLVTLTGPGGTGKTRLALQVIAGMIDNFKDGAHFIDLASAYDPESVLAAIARTVGLRETSDRPLLDDLKTSLKLRNVLLLLDNLEQVIVAVPMIGELLRDCLSLKLLATSREALRVRGEHVFPVPPFRVPGAEFRQLSVEQIAGYEAVQFFVERATAAKPDFELTRENALAVAKLCSQLDGLPLAIELAAARISLFSPQAMLERVGKRLAFLRGGARDLPARQQTLRHAIDWSHDLLDTGEQRLFALLSVFTGFTFEQVEKVAGGIRQLADIHTDTIDGLGSLLDKSLIRLTDQNIGEPRLMMLETIREYAKEQLEIDSVFNAAALQAHAYHFADFAQRHWKRLTSDEREAALREIEPDIENIRTAWHYWVEKGNLEQLHKLSDCLWLLYDARGWYHATADLTSDLLNVLSSTPSTPERAREEIMLQTTLARLLMAIKGCTPEVERAYTRALELCQRHGEIPQSLPVLRALAGFYAYVADFEKSAHFGQQIFTLGERFDDANMRVEGHLVLGYNLAFLGKVREGITHLEKGTSLYHHDAHGSHSYRVGNNPGVTSYTTSAICAWMLGSLDRALKLGDDAMDLANKLNHPYSKAYALFHTGLLHLWMRNHASARERARAVLEISDTHEFLIWNAAATCLLGAARAGMGEPEDGLLELKQGMETYTELKTPPVFWPMLLLLRGGACVQTGRHREGLPLIDEALSIIGGHSRNPLLAEFFRLKGEALLMTSEDNLVQAESLIRQALDLAREQQTIMFELKAALSLTRLLQKQGKPEEGQQFLKEAYGKFTEGFASVDLIEARDLLSTFA